MKNVNSILVGAGQRGYHAMGKYAIDHPDELKFIAVVEPIESRRNFFGDKHKIPHEMRFASVSEILDKPRIAPVCFNASMDRQHLNTGLALMDKGYHLYLEKPMAHTAAGCFALAKKAREKNLMLQICHPLRYTVFYSRLYNILQSGVIGRIITMSMTENISYWHFSHSYVRGNWGVLKESGPLILTKCCHDMDLATWFAGVPAKKVASFASLIHFRKENAPEGAPEYCVDNCPAEKECPYFAPDIYKGPLEGWALSKDTLIVSPEDRLQAFKTGPYGRCVYRCDNDVPDHQVVSAEFENGITLDFAVRASSYDCFREIRIMGSKGEISGNFEKNEMTVKIFSSDRNKAKDFEIIKVDAGEGGHGGGDPGAIGTFLKCYQAGDTKTIKKSTDIAVEGHLLAFAVEKARTSSSVVDVGDFRNQITNP
jgi:predicted dehydrogenase